MTQSPFKHPQSCCTATPPTQLASTLVHIPCRLSSLVQYAALCRAQEASCKIITPTHHGNPRCRAVIQQYWTPRHTIIPPSVELQCHRMGQQSSSPQAAVLLAGFLLIHRRWWSAMTTPRREWRMMAVQQMFKVPTHARIALWHKRVGVCGIPHCCGNLLSHNVHMLGQPCKTKGFFATPHIIMWFRTVQYRKPVFVLHVLQCQTGKCLVSNVTMVWCLLTKFH